MAKPEAWYMLHDMLFFCIVYRVSRIVPVLICVCNIKIAEGLINILNINMAYLY